jgi:hypothetical protein
MIREHGRKDRYYVIDINYFPGKLLFSMLYVGSISLPMCFCAQASYSACRVYSFVHDGSLFS